MENLRQILELLKRAIPQSGYNPNEGMEWSYMGGGTNPILDALLKGTSFERRAQPNNPFEIYGVDRGYPLGNMLGQDELNYREMSKYNPYVADKWRSGGISLWDAQQILNNGNVRGWMK